MREKHVLLGFTVGLVSAMSNLVGACGGDFTNAPMGHGGDSSVASIDAVADVSATSSTSASVASGGGAAGSTASSGATTGPSTSANTGSGPTTSVAASSVSASTAVTVAAASSTGSGNGLTCLSCATMKCPAAVACINDPACMMGYQCFASKCTNAVDKFACGAMCFGNNVETAKTALNAAACVNKYCQAECAGVF